MEDFLRIGKIIKVHGIKGELKVFNLSDYSERFNKLKWAYINMGNNREVFNIECVRYLNNIVILKLEGIDDANTAKTFVNKYIEVDRENAIKLPENTYFVCDIIGIKVFDEKHGYIGDIADVMTTGFNDVYVVKAVKGSEVLIPALKAVVISIDIQQRIMKVNLPEGLLENEV